LNYGLRYIARRTTRGLRRNQGDIGCEVAVHLIVSAANLRIAHRFGRQAAFGLQICNGLADELFQVLFQMRG
jgi:hypothetical protein